MTPTTDAMNWEAEAKVATGGFEMGPIRPHFDLNFKTNNKSEHEVTIQENMVYEKDINVASTTVIDVNSRGLKSA